MVIRLLLYGLPATVQPDLNPAMASPVKFNATPVLLFAGGKAIPNVRRSLRIRLKVLIVDQKDLPIRFHVSLKSLRMKVTVSGDFTTSGDALDPMLMFPPVSNWKVEPGKPTLLINVTISPGPS